MIYNMKHRVYYRNKIGVGGGEVPHKAKYVIPKKFLFS